LIALEHRPRRDSRLHREAQRDREEAALKMLRDVDAVLLDLLARKAELVERFVMDEGKLGVDPLRCRERENTLAMRRGQERYVLVVLAALADVENRRADEAATDTLDRRNATALDGKR
jgi:hypothetical protein